MVTKVQSLNTLASNHSRRKHWTSKSASQNDGAVVSHRRTLNGITILCGRESQSVSRNRWVEMILYRKVLPGSSGDKHVGSFRRSDRLRAIWSTGDSWAPPAGKFSCRQRQLHCRRHRWLFLDGDDRRDQGSKDDCRGMELWSKKSHTDSNRRPTFATTTFAVESPGKARI